MNTTTFFAQLDERIRRYDLLCHPFYQAWAAGTLTREDLREYGSHYYHHVSAFPTYLAQFCLRLEDGPLRRSVLANMVEEQGGDSQPSHADLWLDFVAGMGGRKSSTACTPAKEVADLVSCFSQIAAEGTPAEALAAFYAYESQVPRVAAEKNRGLRDLYGADESSRAYFILHTTADVYHSRVWRTQLEKQLTDNPQAAEKALASAEKAAQALWRALDGIEERRQSRLAA